MLEGINQIEDVKISHQLLEKTSQACANPRFKILIKETLEVSKQDLDIFIDIMNRKMKHGERFEKIGENAIQVSIPECLCPLVRLGLTFSPTLCTCSTYWLKESFEAIPNLTADVLLDQTILRGDPQCQLTVLLKDLQ